MATKVPISIFIQELEAALNRKDGYIMGARGQNPKTGSLDLSVTKESNSWKPTGWYYTQYDSGYSAAQKKKALYWREHATRVWDCNGLAEGIYEIHTGININARARNNYAEWCNPKGSDMSKMPKEPGVAVFKYSSSAGYITHVGYLWKPVNASKPNGDWYVIEAKGVLYGVVRTVFSTGGWNRWGKMTKYYDYSNNTTAIDPVEEETNISISGLKKGDEGKAVSLLQQLLLNVGEVLPKYGIDGDFGSETQKALINFQTKNNIPTTGVVDAITESLLNTQHKTVTIVGGNCNVRVGPGLAHKSIGIAHKGDVYEYGGSTQNNWNQIIYKTEIAWVSGKYSEVK